MPPNPGGGIGETSTSANTHPDRRTVAPAWAGGSALGGSTRTFSQIIEQEKSNRNIIELQIQKIISTDENGCPVESSSKTINQDYTIIITGNFGLLVARIVWTGKVIPRSLEKI